MPTTAANWWLFRVACKLRKLKAANSKSRNGLSRQIAPAAPAGTADCGDSGCLASRRFRGRDRFFLLGRHLPCRRGCSARSGSARSARRCRPPRERDRDRQPSGIKKLSPPQRSWHSPADEVCNEQSSISARAALMKSGIEVSSAMFREKIGLLMVPASSIG